MTPGERMQRRFFAVWMFTAGVECLVIGWWLFALVLFWFAWAFVNCYEGRR